MVKVNVLSKFGFKVQDSTDWVSCDKSLLNSVMFQTLSKGDDISFTKDNFNKEGFLMSFVKKVDVPKHRKEVGSNSPNVKSLTDPYILNNSLPTSIIKNSQMYGQCVNLAFNHVSNNECGLNIIEAFDLADKIYIEYIKRVGGN